MEWIWNIEGFMENEWCSLAWYWHDVRFYFHGFGKDQLWLTKYEVRMRDDYKDWYDIDMCGEYFMIDWICIVCGQYVNPWDP